MMTAWALVLWLFFPTAAWCVDTGADESSWEAYSIITERNIFSRNRRPRSVVSAQTVRQVSTVTRTEQSYLVLRGVVREQEGFISFIEDSRSGEVKKVRKDEAIGGGTLADITLDDITFHLADADTRVEIGKTLEGKAPEASSSQNYYGSSYSSQQGSYDTQQTTTQVSQQTTVSEDEAKDILQRLKERRKKELGE
jgi:hypothetical protein